MAEPTVFLVEDDADVRRSLTLSLEATGLRVAGFASAEAFLAAYAPGQPGCLVLDVGMPGMGGLELQDELNARAVRLPVVFITGQGNVPTSVRAIKAGALDFLEKPFSRQTLLRRVGEALALDAENRRRQTGHDAVMARFRTLTPREREVMTALVAGAGDRTSKHVAARLRISHRTVDHHRARVMEKMQARSLPDLIRIAAICGVDVFIGD